MDVEGLEEAFYQPPSSYNYAVGIDPYRKEKVNTFPLILKECFVELISKKENKLFDTTVKSTKSIEFSLTNKQKTIKF